MVVYMWPRTKAGCFFQDQALLPWIAVSRGPKRILEMNSFLAVRILQSVTGVEDASPEWGRINQEITQETLGLHENTETVTPRKNSGWARANSNARGTTREFFNKGNRKQKES